MVALVVAMGAPMTLHRDGLNDICFECDGCSVVLDTNTPHFPEALQNLRAMGWKAKQVKGTWEHRCICCVEEFDEGGDEFEDVS